MQRARIVVVSVKIGKNTRINARALVEERGVEGICDVFIAFIPFFIWFIVEKLLGENPEAAVFYGGKRRKRRA